jgi:hypothetical protein
MSKSPRRRTQAPRQSQVVLPHNPPPRAISETELRELMNEEISKRIAPPRIDMPGGVRLEPVCPACGNGARLKPCPACNPPIDRAKPLADAQTDAAPSLTVPAGLGLPIPQVEPHGRNAPTALLQSGETRTSNATPAVKSFEPSDIEAALRRSPAFKEAPPSQAQIVEEAETNPATEPQKDTETASSPVSAECPSPVAIRAATRFPSLRLKAFAEILFWATMVPLVAILLGFMADIAVAAAIEFWPVAHAIADGAERLLGG